jgi:hypothetical protein
MTRHALFHFLAYTILIGALFLWLIDALGELNIVWALRIKWSLLWYALRYLFGMCSIVLALDVIF